MSYVVFETPGILDLRSITTFGINSKPNSESPIGFFGTGLKFAIAVLVRTEQVVQIQTALLDERQTYVFKTRPELYRDKMFSFIDIHGGDLLYPKELPFTTELGKNWELWQAFRELYSNTLDENGVLNVYDNYSDIPAIQPNTSRIIIDGAEFRLVAEDKDKIFLPDALRTQTHYSMPDVQVFNQPSAYIYYRGLRVYDLDKPSEFTYNIVQRMDLTEDRTLKYPNSADSLIMRYIANEMAADIVGRAVTADGGTFEGSLNYNNNYYSPSPHFMETVTNTKTVHNPTIDSYVKQYIPKDPPPPKRAQPWQEILLEMVAYLEDDDLSNVRDLISDNKERFTKFLKRCIDSRQQDIEVAEVFNEPIPENPDDIPF